MSETDSYGRHEALHTAHLLADAFSRWIVDHRAIKANPTLNAKAEELAVELADFYQLCGAEFLGPGRPGR